MPKKEILNKGFDSLINTTIDAFAASSNEDGGAGLDQNIPRMVNNRQSVYRVPLSMIRPDKFQARSLLPLALRGGFYSGKDNWESVTRQWMKMAESDRLINREIEELLFLGDSLHDEGQIKPVTGQVVSENGRDIFLMLTGERRFWATAIRAIKEGFQEDPHVLAIIDNKPTLSKQIAENMAYKALTAVGKARAAARIVLEANGILPKLDMNEYEYFTQVAELRLNEETRQSIQDTLQIERTYYGRLMKFFDLPPHLLEVCDKSEMPERVLREIMQYDVKYWEPGVLFYAERDGRGYMEVHNYLEKLVGNQKLKTVRPATDPTTKSARALHRFFLNLEDIPHEDKIGALVDALLTEVDAKQVGKLVNVLDELKRAIDVRMNK